MKTADELAPLRNLVDRVRVGMLTTVDADGKLRARPLQTLELDAQGQLWFLISALPAEREEMNREYGRVGIAYADPNKQDYASISGSGTVVHDPDRMSTHWNAWVELWFPQGVNDPDLALVRVTVEQAEYWEGPGSAARLFSVDEARLRR